MTSKTHKRSQKAQAEPAKIADAKKWHDANSERLAAVPRAYAKVRTAHHYLSQSTNTFESAHLAYSAGTRIARGGTTPSALQSRQIAEFAAKHREFGLGVKKWALEPVFDHSVAPPTILSLDVRAQETLDEGEGNNGTSWLDAAAVADSWNNYREPPRGNKATREQVLELQWCLNRMIPSDRAFIHATINRIPQGEFAALLGCTQSAVSHHYLQSVARLLRLRAWHQSGFAKRTAGLHVQIFGKIYSISAVIDRYLSTGLKTSTLGKALGIRQAYASRLLTEIRRKLVVCDLQDIAALLETSTGFSVERFQDYEYYERFAAHGWWSRHFAPLFAASTELADSLGDPEQQRVITFAYEDYL